MAVFCCVGTVSTSVLVHISMGFHVTVQHRFVDASVVTFGALEGLGAEMIPKVIF